MLPEFDEHGNLPPGVHRCEILEVVARFGIDSAERQVESAELAEFVQWARQSGVARLIVDGSYVTAKEAPNDVDVVILPGPDYPRQEQPTLASSRRWPFVHVQIAQDEADLQQWIDSDFGFDRDQARRGVVEILL
ncbi:MAG: hypothetical protein JNM56_24345 [Planctomycetia bacterium]|nr:hypothetical protein [Planctomycetia bacterium]